MEIDFATPQHVSIDLIKEDGSDRLQNLKSIRQEIIGSYYSQEHYFNKGILELILP